MTTPYFLSFLVAVLRIIRALFKRSSPPASGLRLGNSGQALRLFPAQIFRSWPSVDSFPWTQLHAVSPATKNNGGGEALVGLVPLPDHPILSKGRMITMTKKQQLEFLDPATLALDINVRKDAELTAGFIASLKEHGVMEPVLAHRNADGVVRVLMGQRRTLGAVEAGLTSIPVVVKDSPEEAERIMTQMVENIQRTELSGADEADAYKQLSLMGISAAQMAKGTGRDKTVVEGTLKASATGAGTKALQEGMTLEQALVLAEFDGDEDAIEELNSVIADEPHYLDHVAQRIRDKKVAATALEAKLAELADAGTTVVDEAGNYADSEAIYTSALNRADGEPADDEDANAFVIQTNYRGEVSVRAVVTGWQALGFVPKYERHGQQQAQSGPMTDEQKDARRILIANNKSMESATVVRQEWVKTLLSRKTAPRAWAYFVVHAITHHPETAQGYESHVAATMIGAKTEGQHHPLRSHVDETTARAEFALIALICGGYEKRLPKDSWRSPYQIHKDYLEQLVTWGYTASAVEQIILDA